MNKRKQLRLKEYDYSQNGMYFVTICTKDRKCILSEITVGAGLVPALRLKHFGKIVEDKIKFINKKYSNIEINNYIIMPNHIHFIIEINWAGTRPALTFFELIRCLKSKTTLRYIQGVKSGIYKVYDKKVWQRSYYEHIIRNEKEYLSILEYIYNNPAKWTEDKYYI